MFWNFQLSSREKNALVQTALMSTSTGIPSQSKTTVIRFDLHTNTFEERALQHLTRISMYMKSEPNIENVKYR